MIRAIIFSLLAGESALCMAMWRRRAEYPITTITMLAVAALYGWLSWVRYAGGTRAYYDAVNSTRGLFMFATAAIAIESVRLMSRRYERSFAFATSLLFALLSAVTAWGAGNALRPGAAWFSREQEWAIGCIVFLVANHWLYRRGGELPAEAQRHALGAMVMLAGNATAFLLLGEGRGVYWAEVAGLLIQRLGPMAGLVIWLRR